ncbi:MAG: M48 family metalloprotease [Planctomycetota bacterium]|nr:M48 family metalloprotease [Planctomycetota bacterium]
MPLPFSFILGLFCIISAEDLTHSLPRDPDPSRLYPYLVLVILPWVLARFALRPSGRARLRPRTGGRLAAAALRLPGLVLGLLPIPVVCWVLLGPGDLHNLIESWTGHSALLQFLVSLVPLILLEMSAAVGRKQAARVVGPRAGYETQPLRGRMIGFLTIPPLLFFAVLDLIRLSRELELLVYATGVGLMVAMGLLLIGMAAILPPLSRWVLPTSREVPADVEQTAGLLGFPAKDVLQLHSDGRIVNAGLVGPIPGLRYLILTDGLLRALDPVSLRGVVAHEVGHARAGHPLLLVAVVVLPMLFLHPLLALGFGEFDEYLQLALLVLVILVGLRVVRQLAHRFELEADQLSAEALGGAGPCILALLKFGSMFGGSGNKSSFRHPSDETRIDHLLRCEGDPWFRELFERRGLVLRRWIFAILLIGVGANIWAQAQLWPMDRLVVYFYTGRFGATQQALEALPADLSESDSEFVARLREELVAARSVCPAGGRWEDIRDQLARTGWQRGATQLIELGGAAARAWFALGISAQRDPTALQHSLYLYADAAASDDEELTETLRQHLIDNFELPASMAVALRR